MPDGHIIEENQRRQAMWEGLVARGGPIDVLPGLLRELGIYGGAQGIWVNKSITSPGSPDGAGIAVGVLHNGSSYDDDLSDDGIIYHSLPPNAPSVETLRRRQHCETRSPSRSRSLSSRTAN